MITPRELLGAFLGLALAYGAWKIYWALDVLFPLTPIASLVTGAIIILGALALFKFKIFPIPL